MSLSQPEFLVQAVQSWGHCLVYVCYSRGIVHDMNALLAPEEAFEGQESCQQFEAIDVESCSSLVLIPWQTAPHPF